MIAVVGMALRVPSADSPDALWARLVEGADCLSRFMTEPSSLNPLDRRLLSHGVHVPVGGRLDGVSDFDAGFFELSPLEAALLDPQHRIFLEVVRHALDDGAAPASRNHATAVFAGCGMSSYLQHHLLSDLSLVERVGSYPLMLGNDKDFLTTRVSHKLALGGPSIGVQTACSTSLVAVHLAVGSLLAGECDTAVAGGVTIRLPQDRGYLHQPDGVLSADGVCRPFDAQATGFVPSNGAVAVVLRRLDDAIADGDPIRAVLRATAVNNDGAARPGFTAPGLAGQVRVLSEALALSGLAPDDVTHVETHGTATALGDAVEFEALRQVYGAGATPCHLGAGKANLGHTDTAAGALGLVKAILALQHRRIPPVAHFNRPNPHLGLDGSRFRVPTAAVDWMSGGPLRAAVTSLGLGGTNAHVVIEEAPSRPVRHGASTALVVSAHSLPALQARMGALLQAVTDEPDRAAGLTRSLAGEDPMVYRAVVEPPTSGRHPSVPAEIVANPARLVFAFPGGGAQHPAMVAAMARSDPGFAAALEQAMAHVEPLMEHSLRGLLLHPDATAAAALRRPSIGLPALFCVQTALWTFLRTRGVTPTAVIGHSSGEYAAACVAGVLEPGEAARLVVTRAHLLESAPRGAMVGLLLTEDEARGYLAIAPGLEIAAVNGPAETVVGGPESAIAALEAHLAAAGLPSQRIRIDVAAHTAQVADAAVALEEAAATIPVRAPVVAWVSNVTGTWVQRDGLTPAYWGAHLRHTVRFADGVRTLLDAPGAVVLDVGPGQVLKASMERAGLRDRTRVVAALPQARRDVPMSGQIERAMAELWAAGVDIDLTQWSPVNDVDPQPLPPYPFQRTRCWVEPRPAGEALRTRYRLHVPDAVAIADPWPPEGDPAAHAPAEGVWLMLRDDSRFAAATAAELERAGREVVRVTHIGEVHGPTASMLDSGVAGLLVVAGSDPVWAHHALTDAARSVAAGPPGRHRLVCIVDGRSPVSGLCSALVRVIGNEYPDLAVSCHDVGPDARDTAASGHVLTAPGLDGLIRGGRPFRRVLRPIGDGMVTRVPVRPSGVWIITGGLGAIGRTLAVHLAESARARLILVSRSKAAPDTDENRAREEALRSVEAAGGRYEIVLGDIADPAVAHAAVARAEHVYGGLDGVIHAAGIPAGGMIELRGRDDAEAVLRPKVGGLLALDEALGDRPLEAFVLCSALDASIGTPGQAEHCAANGYLDAFAAVRSRPDRPIVSIGWSAWRDIGQAARAVVPEAMREWRRRMMATALTPAEGVAVFEEMLAAGRPHVLVSVDDIHGLGELAAQPGSLATDDAVAAAFGPDDSLQAPLERRLGELWIEVLGVGVVGADDDFFAAGGHSLAAMQLVTRLRETFNIPVTLPSLLRNPRLCDQIALIEGLLIDAVEGLDDAEVARRLQALDDA